MIIDWTGQHLYFGGWSAWSYNPYGVEEGVYVPATLNYYGDVFDWYRPNMFGRHGPEIVRDMPINIDPPREDQAQLYMYNAETKYMGKYVPNITQSLYVPKLSTNPGVHKPVIKVDAPRSTDPPRK